MMDTAILIALILLTLSMLGSVYRIVKGPTMSDRVVALDLIGVQLIGVITLVSVMLRTEAYLDIVLLIGILSFLGTVAFARYLEKGVVIERERTDDR